MTVPSPAPPVVAGAGTPVVAPVSGPSFAACLQVAQGQALAEAPVPTASAGVAPVEVGLAGPPGPFPGLPTPAPPEQTPAAPAAPAPAVLPPSVPPAAAPPALEPPAVVPRAVVPLAVDPPTPEPRGAFPPGTDGEPLPEEPTGRLDKPAPLPPGEMGCTGCAVPRPELPEESAQAAPEEAETHGQLVAAAVATLLGVAVPGPAPPPAADPGPGGDSPAPALRPPAPAPASPLEPPASPPPLPQALLVPGEEELGCVVLREATPVPASCASPDPGPEPPAPAPPVSAPASPTPTEKPSEPPPTPVTHVAGELHPRIVRALQEGVPARREVELTLTPERLGHLKIELSLEGDQTVRVHVQAQNREVLPLLDAQASDLRSRLEESGLQLAEFRSTADHSRQQQRREPEPRGYPAGLFAEETPQRSPTTHRPTSRLFLKV